MALIKHIALFSDNPQQLAEYYADVFGMKITGSGSHGDYWVTDGYIDMAILPHATNNHVPLGINHFGFTLDSDDEKLDVAQRMAKYGIAMTKPPVDRPYVEDKGKDIDGNVFDVSTSAVAKADAAGKVQDKPVGAEASAH